MGEDSPLNARFLAESTCEIQRPYYEVVAYLDNYFSRGVMWANRINIASAPVLVAAGQSDAAEHLLSHGGQKFENSGDVLEWYSEAGHQGFRFEVKKQGKATQVRTIYYS